MNLGIFVVCGYMWNFKKETCLKMLGLQPCLKVNLFNSSLKQGRLVETGGKNRISMGQHHLRMKQFDVMVTCPPIIIQPKTKEPLTLLKIFGPDRNCDHVLAAANQQHELNASAIQQKLVMFTISHQQLVNHNFNENRWLSLIIHKISKL